MSDDSSSGGFWVIIGGIWFMSGLFGGDTEEPVVDSKPVAAQVAEAPVESETAEPDTKDPWDPDTVFHEEGVTDATELFKDTFAAVKDPFEKSD